MLTTTAPIGLWSCGHIGPSPVGRLSLAANRFLLLHLLFSLGYGFIHSYYSLFDDSAPCNTLVECSHESANDFWRICGARCCPNPTWNTCLSSVSHHWATRKSFTRLPRPHREVLRTTAAFLGWLKPWLFMKSLLRGEDTCTVPAPPRRLLETHGAHVQKDHSYSVYPRGVFGPLVVWSRWTD